MKRFSVELKITYLIILAIIAVLSSGYLAYNSINFILAGIKKDAQPNLSILVLKEINNSLQFGESNIEYYTLTGNKKYLKPYYEVISSVDEKIDLLNNYNKGNKLKEAQIDTISFLLEQKFRIWTSMLDQMNANRVNDALNKLSDALELATDTVIYQLPKSVKIESFDTLETPVISKNEDRKSNIFSRIFRKKPDDETTSAVPDSEKIVFEERIETIDTTIAIGIDKNIIQEEITQLKNQEGENTRRLTANQISLRKQNVKISLQLDKLISKMESEELESFKSRAKEADILVAKTKNWTILFFLMFLILLIAVIYIIQSYIRKTHATQIALTESKDAALKLSRAKEQFLANMSHEIRTPMNAIIGFTEQILQMSMDDKPRKQLEVVKDSADHLQQIINDILDFSKLEADKLKLEKQAFYIEDTLSQCYQLFKPSADNKNIKLKLNASKLLPRVLIGDSLRLKQIIINLISNAIKFTDKGEIIIKAKFKKLSEKNGKLILEIKDSGIGIPEEKLQSIFDEFTQAEDSTTRNYGGTGLGLAIVQKLIKLHDGSIEVKNNPDKGACFTVSINYRIGEEKDIIQIENETELSPKKLAKKPFLVADDDEYNRNLIQHILEKWEVKYTIVKNGKECIETLKKESFDLVLLDIHMPIMNGYEVAKSMRNKNFEGKSDTPIIALTASTGKEEVNKCKKAGINKVLAKPYKEVELLNSIYDILNIPKSKNNFISNTKTDLNKNNSKIPNSNEFPSLYKLANNDKSFIQEMLIMFIKTTDENLISIDEAYNKNDWQNFAELVHKIKSPCRHLDAKSLSDQLKKLEQIARDGKKKSQLTNIYEMVRQEIQILLDKVKLHLENNFSVE